MEVAKITISGTIGEPDKRLDSLLGDTGVGSYFSSSMLRAFFEKESPDAEAYEVIVDSPGGDVVDGFAMYDLIKSQSKPVTTIAKRADSIASVVFLAGNVRKAVKGASFVIHNAWISPADLEPSIMLNAQTLERIKSINEDADQKLLSAYMDRAGRDASFELRALMESETSLSGEQLLAFNFANEIIDGHPSKALRAFAFNSRIMNLQDGPITTYADVIGFQDGKVLMIQRKLEDEFEGGKWAFPGGKVMQGETIEEGAIRELKEETGYDVSSIQKLDEIVNEDESTSHYFVAQLTGSAQVNEEVNDIQLVEANQVSELDILLNGKDRYQQLISKTMSEERLSLIEKGLNSLKALIQGNQKNMIVQVPDGPSLYIFSEDGELAGKRAVLAEGGEPTDQPAPSGTHALEDGREIVIGEGGVIESVGEATQGMTEEEMQAAVEAEKQKYAVMMEEEKKAMQTEKEEAIQALRAEFEGKVENLSNELMAIKNEVKGEKKEDKKNDVDFKKLTPTQRILQVRAQINKQ